VHYFWTALFACIALIWIVQGVRAMRGMRRLPHIADVEPSPETDCPRVSVIFAARDEAEMLPAALESLLGQDYSDYEVIAADDRSEDATGQILDEFARQHDRLKIVHVAELPEGWLGKPHGLYRAYERSSGNWLVFTDADVHFAPDLLRRAVALAKEMRWDHLTLLGALELRGFWEKTGTVYFGVGFLFGVEPWQVRNPRSRRYMGAGYFQLVRRSTYEAIGTHRRLALEIVDDMKLGKLIKLGGFSSGVAVAHERVRLRWHKGLRGIIRGVTKNFFAVSNYSILRVSGDVLSILALSVLPFLGVVFAHGLSRVFAGIAALGAIAIHTWCARNYRIGWYYGLTHPLGGLIFCYMLLRSTVVTLWRGGVVWRGTFYPLEQLKRGLVR
jgi:glycosyltransferase involved in cell wall biosynthesis